MKRIGIIWMLLAMFAVAVQSQSAKQYFKAGDEFSKKLNFKDAIDQYNKAIELDPDFDKAYIQRAMAYSNQGDYENAAKDFDRALVFDEKDAELYFFSGEAHHKKGSNIAALEKLNRAIDLKGNFLAAYQVRSVVYLQLEQYDKALEDCKKCLRLKEDDRGYFNLAQVYEKLDMYNEAEQAYLRAIESDPSYALAHHNLGVLLDLYLHRPADALPHYRRYQDLLAEPDAAVGRWIIDLERRVGVVDETPRVAQEDGV